MTDGRVIELHVRELSQLFDSLDPSPFRDRDLSHEAEEYVVDSVNGLPSQNVRGLIIHLDRPVVTPDEDRIVRDAIRIHFTRRSRILRQQLRRLLKRGRISLGIGLSFLITFFILGELATGVMPENGVTQLLREGLVIGGCVAMWRPLEIFLYDWWPIRGESRLHDLLSRIHIDVVPRGTASGTISPEGRKALARWENEGGHVPGKERPRD